MIKYICKFCGQHLGVINQLKVSDEELGFNSLTPLEQQSIISYMYNGDMVVKVVCEYCQEALEKNPELSLISNPLQ